MAVGTFGTNKENREFVVQAKALAAEHGSGTASSGAVTLNAYTGKITTDALTTSQNGIETVTLTNSKIAAADIVTASLTDGTNSQGTPMLIRVTPAAGSCVITFANKHASAEALNGTLVVSFVVHKAI